MTDARALIRHLDGDWWGTGGNAPCPLCQPEARRDQRALSVGIGRDGGIVVHCHKNQCDVFGYLRGRAIELSQPGATVGAQQAREEATRIEKTQQQARRVWTETGAAEGTLVERYLRARAIAGAIPPALRFTPWCWHLSGRHLPAMVAAVTMQSDAAPIAVHRTYLAEPGRKAEMTPPKAMLCPVRGGAVRLATGSGPLVVAEGVETALSIRDRLTGHGPSVWAALSASGLGALQLPKAPGTLVIAPDADAAGQAAAEALGYRADAAGWSVQLLPPPPGFNDWNDAARARLETAA